MWVFAQFLPVLALWQAWSGKFALLALLLAYVAFRRLRPANRWPWIQAVTANFVHAYPYFKRQQLVLDVDEMPKPNSGAIFSFHMHGVLTCGYLLNGCAHPAMRKSDPAYLVGSGLFGICFLSDLLYWFNFVPWTKEVLLGKLEAGENVAVMPGGFEEASCYKRNTHRAFLKDRKGWVKYALQYGAPIYPAYTFGEERTYWTWLGCMPLRLAANKYQLPGAVFLGKWCLWFPWNHTELITVIGEPLRLPRIPEPSRDDVSKWHAAYVTHLRAHFDKHKAKYAHQAGAELEIVGPSDFGAKS
eukprot:CAMPEP_0177757506 /NCGR_PEP_ID=MMETSP0491_2-20121128/3679_1 /TAXON_ID=63592 /ORGANISM="Tetraselmis chuii, Strain PLY429" /LENGTH=300 /DNA_ID=CAMNT_0019273161 /DNA_START=162 /DNA_END=1064 /DNA_ORIENTATION=+